MSKPGYWWCPECKDPVDAYHATYEECHDKCGRYLVWKDELTPADAFGSLPALSIRDYFAAHALQGLLTREPVGAGDLFDPGVQHDFARSAYEYADAMLKAREAKS